MQTGWLTALIVIGTNYVALAGEFKPFEGPKPIAVLIESNPWRMVMGSDTPRCIVYENREVLFLKKDGCYQHKLSDQEFAAFTNRLTGLTRLPNPKRFYDLCPNITDQGDTYVYVALGGRHIATQVYGSMPGDPESPHDPDCDEGSKKPDKLPDSLVQLCSFLRSIGNPQSRRWQPKYIEVMVWPKEYALWQPITWPKEWPSLDSERAVKRGDSYSIFLHADLLPKSQKFLRSRRETGALEIGGKKWAATYRYVFPSEPVWRKVLYTR